VRLAAAVIVAQHIWGRPAGWQLVALEPGRWEVGEIGGGREVAGERLAMREGQLEMEAPLGKVSHSTQCVHYSHKVLRLGLCAMGSTVPHHPGNACSLRHRIGRRLQNSTPSLLMIQYHTHRIPARQSPRQQDMSVRVTMVATSVQRVTWPWV